MARSRCFGRAFWLGPRSSHTTRRDWGGGRLDLIARQHIRKLLDRVRNRAVIHARIGHDVLNRHFTRTARHQHQCPVTAANHLHYTPPDQQERQHKSERTLLGLRRIAQPLEEVGELIIAQKRLLHGRVSPERGLPVPKDPALGPETAVPGVLGNIRAAKLARSALDQARDVRLARDEGPPARGASPRRASEGGSAQWIH